MRSLRVPLAGLLAPAAVAALLAGPAMADQAATPGASGAPSGASSGGPAGQPPVPLSAQKQAVAAYLGDKLPAQWHVLHVTEDHDALIAFLGMPINRAFDLAYKPSDTYALLKPLCPARDHPLWSTIGASTDLILEPVAIGKGFARLHCNPTRQSQAER